MLCVPVRVCRYARRYYMPALFSSLGVYRNELRQPLSMKTNRLDSIQIIDNVFELNSYCVSMFIMYVYIYVRLLSQLKRNKKDLMLPWRIKCFVWGKRSSYTLLTYGYGFLSQDENKIRFKFIVYIHEFEIELITNIIHPRCLIICMYAHNFLLCEFHMFILLYRLLYSHQYCIIEQRNQ